MFTTDRQDKQLGRYLLKEELGSGGMATVYRAFDGSLERDVAVKLLHPHLSSHLEAKERFQREAKAIAKLKHPAILEIFDYSGDEGDEVYLVMELIEGSTLRAFLSEHESEQILPEGWALVMRQVAAALAHAHNRGIVHRDVKPENILIGPAGEIKLSDFGIAHFAEMSQMTATGQILGSPAYMSPEHLEHGDLDARADIFSAGTVLYEMLIGRSPFAGKLPHATIRKIIDNDYQDPLHAAPEIGFHLGEIIRRCLQKDIDSRYQTADALREDLERALESVGIGDPEAALVEFLKDPLAWSDRQRARVVEGTLDLGTRARKSKQFAVAAHHYNRVLSIEPGNEHALSSISGLSRRHTLRRVIEGSAIGVVIITLVISLVFMFVVDDKETGRSKRSGSRRTPTSQAQRTKTKPPASVKSAKTQAPKIAPETKPKAGEGLETSPEKPTAAKGEADQATPRGPKNNQRELARIKQKRSVLFRPHPTAVKISIDGKAPFSYGPSNQSQQLTVGSHQVKFIPNDVRRFVEGTWKLEVPPGKEPLKFKRRLQWRSAKLTIKSNINTRVTIPKRTTGKTNVPFDVPIKKGPEEEVAVLISAPGYQSQTVKVKIRAGEPTEVTMNLESANK